MKWSTAPVVTHRTSKDCIEWHEWRGRMGVEPTSEGNTPTHTVLKTGEATGPHPPPQATSTRPGGAGPSLTRGNLVLVRLCCQFSYFGPFAEDREYFVAVLRCSGLAISLDPCKILKGIGVATSDLGQC